jgi:hypothetical protein
MVFELLIANKIKQKNTLVVQALFFSLDFQQYFSYIVVVSFISGGNQSTRRKPPTCCKSLKKTLSHNVVSRIRKV